MKKTDLYNQLHRIRSLDINIWDDWVDWRCQQAEAPRGRKAKELDDNTWIKIMEDIPEIYTWDIVDGNIRFEWVDENGDNQEELIPMSHFVDDMDDQLDLEMLWHCNYYDGPLNGVARYNGEMVWFDVEEYGDWGEDCVRSYQLYRFSKEDMDETIRQHNLFNEMVGYHSNHHPEYHKEFVCKDKDKFQQFYKMSESWPSVDVEQCEKLGIFAYHQFKYYSRPR